MNSLFKSYSYNKLFLISLVLVFCTPILPQLLKIISIALFLVICITEYIKNKSKFKWEYFLFNAGLYLMYVFSLLYSKDLEYGLRKVEISAALVVFPLGFALISKDLITHAIKNLKLFFYVFISAVLVLNIFVFSSFLSAGYDVSSFGEYADFVNRMEGFPAVHSIYLSMYNAIAVLLIFYLLRTERLLKAGIPLIIIGSVLCLGLILLLKKGPIFGLVLVATLLAIKYKMWRVWAFYTVFTASLVATLFLFPDTSQRIHDLFQVERISAAIESEEIRATIYKCGNKKFQEAGLTGFGIGDGKNELLDCYQEYNPTLAATSYNSHNQYISLILNAGFLGLLIFLAFIFYNINRSLKSGEFITVAIIVFYCIVMFSENILERQNGVLYFSLFINLLYFLSKNNQQKPRVNHSQEQILKELK
ncbi:MAG: O-antigen ligase [Pseudohongiellaceae bacterium]|jgi:O-antigen ligase|uniref:O-antigen ligase family protein n=1 Tax=Nonlabens sp. TaxID=1888209 RepID=UPI0039E461CB